VTVITQKLVFGKHMGCISLKYITCVCGFCVSFLLLKHLMQC